QVRHGPGPGVVHERLAEVDPELALLEAGRDVGMGLRVDVGVHAEADRRAHPAPRRHALDGVELLRRLDVDHEEVRVERGLELRLALAHAREDDLPAVGAGAERLPELALRHDVEARSLARQETQDGEVVVRLDGEADEVRDSPKGGVESTKTIEDRRLAVHVERSAERGGEGGERDVLAVKLAGAVGEVTHGISLPAW